MLLVTWAGSAPSLAQPARPASTTNSLPRRFSGKIASVDNKTKTIILQGAAKVEIVITDQTKIVKAKKPAAFDALTAGQMVNGRERLDTTGKWEAETVNVGDQRQPLAEPIPKTFVVPNKQN